MTTFGERLRAAGLAAGMSTPAHFAKRCGIPVRMAERWLKLEKAPHMSAERLFFICDCMKVRPRWLHSGDGMPERVTGDIQAMAALVILHRLPSTKTAYWLEQGRKLIR